MGKLEGSTANDVRTASMRHTSDRTDMKKSPVADCAEVGQKEGILNRALSCDREPGRARVREGMSQDGTTT